MGPLTIRPIVPESWDDWVYKGRGGTQKRDTGSGCQTVKDFFVLTTLLLNKLFETHNFHFVASSCLFVFVIVIVNNNNNNNKN